MVFFMRQIIFSCIIFSGIFFYIPVFAEDSTEVIIHEVKKGETLYSIARKYSVRIPDISEANPEINGVNIKLGQKLRVPRLANKREEAVTEKTVTLGRGDDGNQESEIQKNTQENDPEKFSPPSDIKPREASVATIVRPQVYRVQKGDTFSSLSRKFDISVDDLSIFNDGVIPSKLKIGQELKLSSESTGANSQVIQFLGDADIRPQRPVSPKESMTLYLAPILKELEAIPVQKRRWKNIVLHHSATTEGNARYFDYYHRKVKGWENGLAYHFVIGNGVDSGDGQIEIGSRWKRQIKGGHVRGDELNEVSIGICFVGNFDKNKPSRAQFIAVVELLRYLNGRCGQPIPILWMHREINPNHTACPGKLFPIKALRDIMKASPM